MLKKLYNYMKYLSNRDEFLKRSLNKICRFKNYPYICITK